MSDYAAIVTRVYTRPFPNADRLLLGDAGGYQVVVGLDTQPGELGLLFPPDGQLSEEYCAAHNLIAVRDPATGENTGGYFEENRRVRCQRFRGQRSEGYWAKLDTLAFTGADLTQYREGDRITTANGVPICTKWINPETLKARGQNAAAHRIAETAWFKQHVETDHLRHTSDADFPPGSLVYITEKLHGTSHREGRVPVAPRDTWLDRLARRFGFERRRAWSTMAGTRRVVLGEHRSDQYYGGDFRDRATAGWRDMLRLGEVVYGEIVGWQYASAPIMGTHDPSKVGGDFAKRYPKGPMVYSYGCALGECKFYAYRIVQHGPEGVPLELTAAQMKVRAAQIGVEVVPEIHAFPMAIADGRADELKRAMDGDCEGASLLDPAHEREGVVVRVERPDGKIAFYKHKGFAFRLMEGIATEHGVDMEEAA